MCGRFSLSTTGRELMARFSLPPTPDPPPRFNIAPSQTVAVVRGPAPARELAWLRWGLIPSWADDPAIGQRMINARAETVLEKPAFRAAIHRRRCLIPASGFFEWHVAGAVKRPYFIHTADGALLALAGIWEHWRTEAGPELETCAILTRPAQGLVATLHERMPVVFAPELFEAWLATELTEGDLIADLLATPPAVELAAHPVTRRVGNPAFDEPACVAPASRED